MSNINCLQDFKCPECGYEDGFDIAIEALAIVHDDGTEDCRDIEWGNDSFCRCTNCEFEGIVSDFTIINKKEKVL